MVWPETQAALTSAWVMTCSGSGVFVWLLEKEVRCARQPDAHAAALRCAHASTPGSSRVVHPLRCCCSPVSLFALNIQHPVHRRKEFWSIHRSRSPPGCGYGAEPEQNATACCGRRVRCVTSIVRYHGRAGRATQSPGRRPRRASPDRRSCRASLEGEATTTPNPSSL